MLERNILRDHLAETGDGLALRELGWSELVARLKASSECRSERGQVLGNAGGGFDQFPKLTAEALYEGKRPVNRTALGHGKIVEANGAETAIHVASGDRES